MAAIEPSGCHWSSSLYNLKKDETHRLHSTDCSFSHCSGGGRWRATGWSPPAVDVSEPFDAWGATPLHYAALNNHTAVVERLLAAGAAVDAADNNGQGPRKRPVGTTGGGGRDDVMQSEWKNNSVTSCLMILNAPCAQSCGRIKLITNRW